MSKVIKKFSKLISHLEVALAVVPKEARLGELLAALEALVRLLLVVAAQVLAEHLLVSERPVARLAHVLPVLVGQEVLGGDRSNNIRFCPRADWRQKLPDLSNKFKMNGLSIL